MAVETNGAVGKRADSSHRSRMALPRRGLSDSKVLKSTTMGPTRLAAGFRRFTGTSPSTRRVLPTATLYCMSLRNVSGTR